VLLDTLKPVFVETIPDTIEPGIMYISEKYGGVTYICPCGCGEKVHFPIKPFWDAAWEMTKSGDLVTISPSILMRGGCKSHYFIRENKIVWA
jgi:hypothetical protein